MQQASTVRSIPLKDGSTYSISSSDVEVWQGLYINIDIDQEFRNMLGWTLANPSKQKTARGAKKFINSWLCRANLDQKPIKRESIVDQLNREDNANN